MLLEILFLSDINSEYKKQIKHFWAFIVWDYSDSSIKILEITQAGIQSAIKSLTMDADWGAPYGYDIKVIRKGTTMEDTEYTVNPSPHKKLTEEVTTAFAEKPVNLEALFDGEDPFAVDEKVIPVPIEDMPF